MRHLGTGLKVLGAASLLGLVGNSVSIAATGHGFTLGTANTAAKQTTISRTTNGPVLNLRTKSATAAPFTVNGRGRVANLNADTVDGLDSSEFGRATAVDALAGRMTNAESRVAVAEARTQKATDRATGAQTTADAAQAKADAAQAKADAAQAKATTAQSTAAAVTARMPVAQGYVGSDGSAGGRSYGFGTITKNGTGIYRLPLASGATFVFATHVAQVTPASAGCRVAIDDNGGGALRVFTFNAGSGSAQDCPFTVTVTAL